jgi:uncharacterized membrane protein
MTEPLSADEIFDLLSHRRRRTMLEILHDADEPLALADVAREIAAVEYEVSPEMIPDGEIEQIYLSLYHRHLGKLTAHGVVAFDSVRKTVVATENADQVAPIIEELSEMS